jgi:uncharacterized phage protein gp47/JayE
LFEHQTYQAILGRMLDRVPATLDKREGSLIYDALAPAAAELAQMYAELDVSYRLSFADTASGEFLRRRCAEFGVNWLPATAARREGLFYGPGDAPVDVPIGSRYSIDGLHYVARERLGLGRFSLECQVAGSVGNQRFGTLLPVQTVPGLARAELAEVLIPGQDDESDDALRQRYFSQVNTPAFGGNVADYVRTINAIGGVGGTRVFPVWNGGGTVKCTIIGSDFNAPSAALVAEAQTIVDPSGLTGQGLGTAPIGHRVTIVGVSEVAVNVETTVVLAADATVGQVQGPIEEAVAAYLLELRRQWAAQEGLVVRTAQIDARVLNIPGVEDVTVTTLNGVAANLLLGAEEIPQLGAVNVNG